MSGVGHDIGALDPSRHVSFGEEKHRRLDPDISVTRPGASSLGRAASSSTRSRSSSLTLTITSSAKCVFSPLRRLSTMSFHSVDSGGRANNTNPSSRTPLLFENRAENSESQSQAAPILPARQPSNNSIQHNRISAHFDDTSKLCTLVYLCLLSTAL